MMRGPLFFLLALGTLVACGSAASSPPVEEPTPPAPDEAATPAPAPADEAEPAPAPAAPEAPADDPFADLEIEEVTGIPACDEYLALYRACEPKLESKIMAGEKRTYRAERGSLEYFMTTEERKAMPEACADMLAALRTECAD